MRFAAAKSHQSSINSMLEEVKSGTSLLQIFTSRDCFFTV
jgi:hypothetical protein